MLGLKDCIKLNLLKRVDVVEKEDKSRKEEFVEKNRDVFTGLGEIGTYKLKLRQDAEPVSKPIRRVPEKIKDRLKETLDRYETLGVLERVECPTAWCNNIVIVEKPDKSLRLCLDPKELNNSIEREKFLIPSPEEIYSDLSEKEVFTVLDLKDGFFQILLDDPEKVCTFVTPFGRYRFLRMPFGISSAPEVMQKVSSKIFGDIDVQVYFDDVIVAGKNKQDHDEILEKVLNRARGHKVKFNQRKLG